MTNVSTHYWQFFREELEGPIIEIIIQDSQKEAGQAQER